MRSTRSSGLWLTRRDDAALEMFAALLLNFRPGSSDGWETWPDAVWDGMVCAHDVSAESTFEAACRYDVQVMEVMMRNNMCIRNFIGGGWGSWP